jgi:hypothetical protein
MVVRDPHASSILRGQQIVALARLVFYLGLGGEGFGVRSPPLVRRIVGLELAAEYGLRGAIHTIRLLKILKYLAIDRIVTIDSDTAGYSSYNLFIEERQYEIQGTHDCAN